MKYKIELISTFVKAYATENLSFSSCVFFLWYIIETKETIDKEIKTPINGGNPVNVFITGTITKPTTPAIKTLILPRIFSS